MNYITKEEFIECLRDRLGSKFKVIHRKNFAKTYYDVYDRKLSKDEFMIVIEFSKDGDKYRMRKVFGNIKLSHVDKKIDKLVTQCKKAYDRI